jgi:hypothetical protein
VFKDGMVMELGDMEEREGRERERERERERRRKHKRRKETKRILQFYR